jgi:thymidylate kinase
MPLSAETNKTALFLSHFFARLNEEKIIYCVLRNYETLPEKVGNDVDIWVKDDHRKRLYSVIQELAFTLDYTLNYSPRLTLLGEGNYFLIKNDKTLSVIHIDCWTYIHWKGLPYIDLAVVEKQLIWYEKGFYIVSPGVMTAIMLLKELLPQGKVKEKYNELIKKHSVEDQEVFLNCFIESFGKNHAEFILEKAQNGNWFALENNVNKLRTALLLRSLHHPFSQLKHWFNYFRAQFRRYFLSPRGIFLVLIGPDGSGKSTTINILFESDIRRLFQKKLYFHGHFPFLPELKSIVAFFSKNKNTTVIPPEDNPPSDLKSLGVLRSMVYPIYYGLNYFLGHFLVWEERAREGLVVFDRYFYDYMMQRLYTNCPRWLLNLIAKIIPQPDILIFLKNSPEIIYARKPELSVEEIKRQSKICEDITRQFKNSFVIDTSMSPDQVVKNIQQIIVNRIREKQKVKA